jgi:hypothetical protein
MEIFSVEGDGDDEDEVQTFTMNARSVSNRIRVDRHRVCVKMESDDEIANVKVKS